MYNTTKVFDALKNIIGWRDHYNLAVVPALPASLTDSETGQYYQDVHPALNLEYIKATLADDDTIEDYLTRTKEIVIPQMLNKLIVSKQLQDYFKSMLRQSVIHNSDGYYKDTIINESRFVGVAMRVHNNKGLKTVIQKIGLQASLAQANLDIYIYHSSSKDPISIFQFNSANSDSFQWDISDLELFHDNGTTIQGGIYYIGYYQDDLTGQAIQYKKLNWESGYCRSCDGGVSASMYDNFSAYLSMSPFYVPSSSFTKGELFDPNGIIYTNDNNWGLNFSFVIQCDLTGFWVDNRLEFLELQGLMMSYRILRDMLYSPKINYVEEQLKFMIIRDLEGDKETRAMNLEQRISRATKAINTDQGSLNSACMPCTKKPRAFIGTA